MSEPGRSAGVPVSFMSGGIAWSNAIYRFSRDPSPRAVEASRPPKDGQTKSHCTGRDNVMDRAKAVNHEVRRDALLAPTWFSA